jgi:hypothetical protein
MAKIIIKRGINLVPDISQFPILEIYIYKMKKKNPYYEIKSHQDLDKIKKKI